METREEEEKKPISQKQNSSQAANKARTPAEITTFTVKASASHGDVPWLRINDPGQVTQCIRLSFSVSNVLEESLTPLTDSMVEF